MLTCSSFRIECKLLTTHYKVLHSLAPAHPCFILLSPTSHSFALGTHHSLQVTLFLLKSLRVTCFLCPDHFPGCYPSGLSSTLPPHECVPQPPLPLPSNHSLAHYPGFPLYGWSHHSPDQFVFIRLLSSLLEC